MTGEKLTILHPFFVGKLHCENETENWTTNFYCDCDRQKGSFFRRDAKES